MSEITREALREHNYCMGIQIGALIEGLGMQWENQKALQNGESIPYINDDFQRLFESYSHVLTHNGILSQWEGVE
jgi:hypothetical protein